MPPFDYEKRQYEDVQERATQRGGDFDSWLKQGVTLFKPKEGLNTVRFIPIPGKIARELGIRHYGMNVFIHYNVGGDKNSYPCLDSMKGQPCPCCDYRKQLEHDRAPKEEIKEVAARKNVIVWVIDRDEERAGPKLWPMTWTIDKEFSQLSLASDDRSYLPIEDPNDGYDVSFRREGTGLSTKYTGKLIARNVSYLMRDEREQASVLRFVEENPLPDVVQYYTAEEMDATLNGRAGPAGDAGGDDRRLRDGERGRGGERDEGRDRDRGRETRGQEPPDRSRETRDDGRDRDRGTGGRDERPSRATERELPQDGSAEEQIDPETGEVTRPGDRNTPEAIERGRADANGYGAREPREPAREPAETPRRRPMGEPEPRGRDAERAPEGSRRLADAPPARTRENTSTRAADRSAIETTDRRRPEPEGGGSTDRARGRLDDMRDRRR